jgi:hypothetical protein
MSQNHKRPHPSNPPADQRNEPNGPESAIIDHAETGDAPESEGRATRNAANTSRGATKPKNSKDDRDQPGRCCG